MAQQAVERTAQSDNKITWATIKDQLAESIHQLTRMKFQVSWFMYFVLHLPFAGILLVTGFVF